MHGQDKQPEGNLLTLDELPSGGMALARAAATVLRRPRGEPRLEPAGACVRAMLCDPEALAAYRRVCGLREAPTLPLTFPHVMVESLQLWLMSRPGFPLPMLGLVHLANRFEQARPIPTDRSLDFTVSIGTATRGTHGLEFEITTAAAGADGERLWTGVSTYLYRMPGERSATQRKRDPLPKLDRYEPIEIPADAGRRYARVSGDYNPIHLYPVTARLFGFKRAIAHGMWSAARCLGALEDAHGVSAKRLTVRFRKPLLLPTTAELRSRADGEDIEFLLAGGRDRLYLEGRLD